MTRALTIATIVAFTATARAEPPDFLYVEALGKAGAYGVGYERTIASRWAIGGAASFVVLRGERLTTVVPYVHATALARGNNALYAELGAELVHTTIPSPVPDWAGMTSTGAGGLAALGWQRTTRRLVLRTTASAAVGRGGVAPMLGFAIGFRP
jgi:hypothetical protein